MLPEPTLRRAASLRALLAAGALPADVPTLAAAVRVALADVDRATAASRRRLVDLDRERLLEADIDRLWVAIATIGPAS